jgi:LL-diaminopimelate aminotransferase
MIVWGIVLFALTSPNLACIKQSFSKSRILRRIGLKKEFTMPSFPLAERLATLPPYLFAEIDRLKNEVKAKGVDIISLGIGDPDMPTPQFIIDALCQAAKKTEHHQYPSSVGMLSFRQAVADWYKERFNVGLSAENEVVGLIGSKEGIAHFPMAFINPGDTAIVCTPNYPVYDIAVGFAGGSVTHLPLTWDNDFLPDLDGLSDAVWDKAKMIFINYPNNPTAGLAGKDFYDALVAKAHKHNTMIVQDAAYTEMYYDAADKPLSIMEIDGAKEVAVEFHSLSKTYNMTGWRVGMMVGNADLVKGMRTMKENVDSGNFQAVQEAGIVALKEGEPYAEANRQEYMKRRDAVCAALDKAGIEHRVPKATFYIWSKTPAGFSSAEFVSKVLEETGVVLTPGNGFGTPGEGYFRISLTVNTERLMEAVSRIEKL